MKVFDFLLENEYSHYTILDKDTHFTLFHGKADLLHALNASGKVGSNLLQTDVHSGEVIHKSAILFVDAVNNETGKPYIEHLAMATSEKQISYDNAFSIISKCSTVANRTENLETFRNILHTLRPLGDTKNE